MARNTQIENRNFLAPTGFKFTIKRSPSATFFCNQANIPDLTLGEATQPTYLRDIPTPGDKIQFGDLNIRFLVDEDLTNYLEISNWIRGLGYPDNLSEFDRLEGSGFINPRYVDSGDNIYSDGTLQVLTSNNVAKFQVIFQDLWPYSLSTLPFDATDTEGGYFTADASFKYTIFRIADLSGNTVNSPNL